MRIVVALGGNALLRKGEPLSMENQQKAIAGAARSLADAIYAGHHLVITHGNGPQVGLLALQSLAGPQESMLPLDVLGAESEGWIGYELELALRNALPEGAAVVTVVTQTLVDANDPAFAAPTKPIGPVYEEAIARGLATEHQLSLIHISRLDARGNSRQRHLRPAAAFGGVLVGQLLDQREWLHGA